MGRTADSPHDVAHRATPAKRRAYVVRRREADASEVYAERLRAAQELSGEARPKIGSKVGFTSVAPGGLPGTDEVVGAAEATIAGLGHDRLMELVEKPMAKRFLPEAAFAVDSPFFRFALSRDVVAPVAAYLGVLPILNYVDVWYSPFLTRPVWSSQMWHLDHADVTQVKVFVHCSDVGPDSGPLTVLDAAASKVLVKSIGYRQENSRVSDDAVNDAVGAEARCRLEGPRASAWFVDTSRCFHFGSRVREGAPPRQVAIFQYLTPHAFVYRSHYSETAPYRSLVDDGSSRWAQLLLGAA